MNPGAPRRRTATVALVAGALWACAPPAELAPRSSRARATAAGRSVRPAFERVEPTAGTQSEPGPPLAALVDELARAERALKAEGELAPYYMAYSLTDVGGLEIEARYGALIASEVARVRLLTADVRVGSYDLDSTHPSEQTYGGDFSIPEPVPLDDGALAVLRRQAWLATDTAYRAASQRYLTIKGEANVRVDIEDQTGDFSREEPVIYYGRRAGLELDRAVWEARARALSARFRGRGHLIASSVRVEGSAATRFLASSEGTRLQSGTTGYRLLVQAEARADDGMRLERTEVFDAATAGGLPPLAEAEAAVERVVTELDALRRAPPAEPYVGPAILLGRAAGVFFHEAFGHRVEGERQKLEEEGQTFAKKVGHKILPDFITIYDDATLSRFEGADLNGFFRFDDEGVRAQRASLVEAGVLKGFLMSRVPVRGVRRSNGHGRANPGATPMARQANLVIESSRTLPAVELKRRLVAEVKQQKKPYGLLFAEIEGGYTETDRESTQGFKVMPVLVYRVWADGRPDELIRGVDIIGTPLTALNTIVATGDDYALFNGMCGAASGTVPVSAIAPSLLLERIEVALRDKGNERPPVLAPPSAVRAKGTP